MPGYNQTGPAGLGPMTGRRMGRCTNYGAKQLHKVQNNPEQNNSNDNMETNSLPGQGFGMGRGWNRHPMGRRGRMRNNW